MLNKYIDGGSDARELAKGHLWLHPPEPSRVVSGIVREREGSAGTGQQGLK